MPAIRAELGLETSTLHDQASIEMDLVFALLLLDLNLCCPMDFGIVIHRPTFVWLQSLKNSVCYNERMPKELPRNFKINFIILSVLFSFGFEVLAVADQSSNGLSGVNRASDEKEKKDSSALSPVVLLGPLLVSAGTYAVKRAFFEITSKKYDEKIERALSRDASIPLLIAISDDPVLLEWSKLYMQVKHGTNRNTRVITAKSLADLENKLPVDTDAELFDRVYFVAHGLPGELRFNSNEKFTPHMWDPIFERVMKDLSRHVNPSADVVVVACSAAAESGMFGSGGSLLRQLGRLLRIQRGRVIGTNKNINIITIKNQDLGFWMMHAIRATIMGPVEPLTLPLSLIPKIAPDLDVAQTLRNLTADIKIVTFPGTENEMCSLKERLHRILSK